ncbi:hypothetical protein ACH5RR_026732 [Cinchona calisaya]|uniref:Late blight resistance protein R1A-like N-terminal domain-containing protein n=1 Tax=Cinchona calisaya TaxID=153742 RepID=A0ABD2Z6Q2_9GENT
MKELVLGFFDYLIHKLKLLSRSNNEAGFVVAEKVQIEILVDELSFLRQNLMDLLLQVPNEKITISTEALIVETRFFVYSSLDKQECGELMDEYSSFGLPDLLEAVHAVRQQASVIQQYFSSVVAVQMEIKSLLQLTCPTPTNVQNVAVASSLASSQANDPPNIRD